jgi:hypothetical protein
MNDDDIRDELDEEDGARRMPRKKPLLDDDTIDPLDSIGPEDVDEEAVGELGGEDGEEAEEDVY